jgi:RimJ/RimL family protein N-acetyltransferase
MTGTILWEAQDHHFGWMLGGGATASSDGLCLPDGEADPPAILDLLRGIAAAHRAQRVCGMWLIVQEGWVTGSCGYMRPIAQGAAEIGYGITASWRGQGLATQAVGALVTISTRRGLSLLTADTAVSNIASQRVLQNNGFSPCGERTDPADGDLLQWRLPLA